LATFQHPASLNVLQQFGQACSILRNTSRATNPAWYQEALDQNFQLHVRTDGTRISSFYHDRSSGQWSPGPSLTEEILFDSTRLESVATEAIRMATSKGATSLGLFLHIADEFSTSELKPELDNPAALPDLRDAVVSDPASVLDDSSIPADQASWRVLPYPAAGSDVIGTTVTLSRQYAPVVATLRQAGEKANFPVIVEALSAPLVTVMGLASVLNPTAGKPFVAILQYPWFTALAFFNEHADLRLIRTLQHRGMRRATNLRHALATTSASLEFIDPDIFLLPLGESVDTTLEANLRIGFNNSRIEPILPPLADGIPAWCPEPSIASTQNPVPARTNSHTFTILRDDKWALQDFLPSPKETVDVYPNRSEMKLLRSLRMAKLVLAAVALVCLGYFGFGIMNIIRQTEWAFDPAQADMTRQRVAGLTVERKKSDHWNNLLEDRSKAWTAMESFSRMFPANGGMLVKTYSHSSKPDTTPGQAKVGIIKEWKITGYSRDEALEYLNSLNTREGINAHFSQIAKATGCGAYNPTTGNRSISVNVRTQENASFRLVPPEEALASDETTYPFTFDLTITQRYEATDPIALTVPKAP
jgi:hypothetical protein